MARTHTLLIAALALAGCHDFVGDLGQLGFESNLELGGEAWTPEASIAVGSEVEVRATRRMAEDASPEDELELEAQATGLQVVHTSSNHIAFDQGASDTGTVRFTGDVEDHFSVHFAEIATTRLVFAEQALVPALAADWDLTEFDLLDGTSVTLTAHLESREGHLLGWNPDQLVVETTGPLTARVDESGAILLAVSGTGNATLDISYADRDLLQWDLRAVPAAAIAHTSLETWELPEGTVALPLGWSIDERPTLGLSHPGQPIHETSLFYALEA